MSERTFQVTTPAMQGADVTAWQKTLNAQMSTWDVDYRLEVDGVYGAVTRDLTASVCHGLGLPSAFDAMKAGVTPDLRVKLRNKRLTAADKIRFAARAPWRAAFRRRHASRDVASPLAVILADSWGYHPPVHDGIDLICKPNAPLLAICRAKVIRADTGGWWGKGARPSGGHPVSDGDGIIVLRSLTDAGPFRKGLNFGYGHAEHPSVRVGQVVEAGDVIGKAGFANAWHIHLVVNGRLDAKGIGDRDPRPFVDFARKAAR